MDIYMIKTNIKKIYSSNKQPNFIHQGSRQNNNNNNQCSGRLEITRISMEINEIFIKWKIKSSVKLGDIFSGRQNKPTFSQSYQVKMRKHSNKLEMKEKILKLIEHKHNGFIGDYRSLQEKLYAPKLDYLKK